jgi:hypothetical protein
MNNGGIRINCLTAQDTVNSGDMFPIWSQTAQDTRRVTGAEIAAYAAANSSSSGMVTQYLAPSATAFMATIATVNGVAVSVWLSLTPTGTLAAGTIVLPPAGTAVDRQEIAVTSSQTVTSLTVSSTGLTVTGAPTTIAANGSFTMRFDATTSTWIRFH